MPPSIYEALPEAGQRREGASDEDRPTTAKPVIERNGQPAADKRAAKVWGRIDEPQEPGRPGIGLTNAELILVKELSAVDDGLV